MDKLEAAVILAEVMKLISINDCAIAVADKEGIVVAYVPADFMIRSTGVKIPNIGDHVMQGSPLEKCLKTKKPVKTVIPKNLLGVKCKTLACPILGDDGQLLGAIASTISMDKQDTLHNTALNIASTTEEMAATAGVLGNTAVQLSEDMSKVKASVENVLSIANKTDNILHFVNEVASNSNLLGLNAAIEAARAGEHGKGFAVVANEIRKMAVTNMNSVNEIKKILMNIKNDTMVVMESVINTFEISQQQAAATQEIAAGIQSLSSTINEIERISEVM